MRLTRRSTILSAGLLIGIGAAGTLSTRAGHREATGPVPLSIVVNLAARRLDVIESGKVTRSFPVTVGATDPKYRTPVGKYRISRAVWNPWWHPPTSSWARGRKPERPGPENPMGRVKLHFSDLLYIHGSMYESDLGWAASHGCIRMSNDDIVALARVVHRYATPKLDGKVLDRLVSTPSNTRTIQLSRPVPLEIRYDIAEVRNGSLLVYPDIYDRADRVRESVLAAMEGAGYEPDLVRRDMLEKVVEAASRSGTSLPLGVMLTQGAATAAAGR